MITRSAANPSASSRRFFRWTVTTITLPFARPAVVVAVHAPLIRTVSPQDAVGMITPQRRAVAVRPTPGSSRARRRRRICRGRPAPGLAHHAVAVAVPHERIRGMVVRHRCDPTSGIPLTFEAHRPSGRHQRRQPVIGGSRKRGIGRTPRAVDIPPAPEQARGRGSWSGNADLSAADVLLSAL